MRPWKILVTLATAAVFVTVVAAVPAGAGHGVNGQICIVNSMGGADNPFNEATAAGAKAAKSKLHVDVVTLDAETETEVIANLDAFVTSGTCDLIVGVSFVVGPLMQPFVASNPDQAFASIDFGYFGAYPNVAEVFFEVDQAAFLAGYIAAGVTETGAVGVFGGLPIPTVTAFMDGYALGVEWYNNVYGTDVAVVGWDPDLQTGLFSFTFDDPAAGQAIAASLYDYGADIVFPVAGITSFGALDEAIARSAAGDDVYVVGVDFDWAGFVGDPDRVILTSVVKDYGPAVFNQAAAVADGTWEGGFFFEGLDIGATEIAPFHRANKVVPGFLKRDLKDLRAGIVDGSIPTAP